MRKKKEKKKREKRKKRKRKKKNEVKLTVDMKSEETTKKKNLKENRG